MIISTSEGRLRIKTNRLKNQRIAQQIKGKVAQLHGVQQVRANPGAASLIILFDQNSQDLTTLEEQVITLCSPPAKRKSRPQRTVSRRLNQASKAGMVATLTASLVYGYLGKKKPHIYYGSAFVGLAGLHMLKHSKTLLR